MLGVCQVTFDSYLSFRGRRGRDCMQSVPITNKVVSSNPVNGEVHSIQHYVIKFVQNCMFLFVKVDNIYSRISLSLIVCWVFFNVCLFCFVLFCFVITLLVFSNVSCMISFMIACLYVDRLTADTMTLQLTTRSK